MVSPLKSLAKFAKGFNKLLNIFSNGAFLSDSHLLKKALPRILCKKDIESSVCENIVLIFQGHNMNNINRVRILS